MRDSYQIIKKPLISEKSLILKEGRNKYTFQVDRTANKFEIKRSLEELFPELKGKVISVNTISMQGKRKRLRFKEGKKPDWKKAIVTLQKGTEISIYEAI